MSISTCPIATVEAPVEHVWQLVADPSNYGLWWDEETVWQFGMEPAGPAKAGQRISWHVRITVASIDPDKRALDLTTQLPFGITVHNHIVMKRRPLSSTSVPDPHIATPLGASGSGSRSAKECFAAKLAAA